MSRDRESGRKVYEGAMKRSTDALMAADDEIARLTAALSEAQRERDALKGEVERLRPFEPRLKRLALEGDEAKATLDTTREFREHFATVLAATVMGENAPNYVEFKVVHPTEGEFAVTVQRCAGKTPHEFRREAEAERDAAVKRAEEAERQAAAQGALSTGYRTSWLSEESKRLAAESKLTLAERVVEAVAVVLRHGPGMTMDEIEAALRAAVAEYRKAVGR